MFQMFHTEITLFSAQCIMHNAQLYTRRTNSHTEITENTESYSLRIDRILTFTQKEISGGAGYYARILNKNCVRI